MTKEKIPGGVQKAIEVIKGDDAGQKERKKAAKIIDNWVGDGASDDYIDRDQAVNGAFADVHGSGALASPIKGSTEDGNHTAPISASAKGTGGLLQKKPPRDLRTRE